jgi:hypothetical protein
MILQTQKQLIFNVVYAKNFEIRPPPYPPP